MNLGECAIRKETCTKSVPGCTQAFDFTASQPGLLPPTPWLNIFCNSKKAQVLMGHPLTVVAPRSKSAIGLSKPLFKTPQHCASIEIQGAAIHVLSVRLNRSTTVCPSSLDQQSRSFKRLRPGVLDQPIKHFPVFPPVRCPN
jgi:hypothetical protein